jgi:hypothetical protein
MPIHIGAVLDSPEYLTAKTEKILAKDHKIPDKIPKYENMNELYANDIIKLDTKIATHIIA